MVNAGHAGDHRQHAGREVDVDILQVLPVTRSQPEGGRGLERIGSRACNARPVSVSATQVAHHLDAL